MKNVVQTFPRGTGGGHTILDTDGTALAKEDNLQFEGLDVNDNPTDNATKVGAVGLNSDSIEDIASGSLPSTILVGNGLNYSTSEQVVGRWIDGKPIYQKTWLFPTVTTSNSLGMTLNLERVISYFGTVVNIENECLMLNCAHPQYQDLYGLFTCVKSTSIEMRSINGHEWSLSNLRSMKITIQYTKDTD